MLFLLLLLLPTHLGGKDWDKSKSFLSLSHSPSVLRHLFFVFCSKFNSSVMFLLSCSDLLLSVVRPVLFIFLGFFFSVALFVLFSCCCLVCTTYTVIMTWLFHLYTNYSCLVFAVPVLKFLPWPSFVAFLHCMYVY
jgi:hypothetical protein